MRADTGRRRTSWSQLVLVLATGLGLVVTAVPPTEAASSTGGARAADPRPGAPGAGDPVYPFYGNGGYNAKHYAVTVRVPKAAKWIRGRAVVTARATQDLSRFDLDLHGLTVRSVTVDGAPATWSRWRHKLVITPAKYVPNGHSFRTVVRYQGRPMTVMSADGGDNGWFLTDDGVSALGEPFGASTWMPVSDHPSDKATFAVTAIVRPGRTVVSNGLPVGKPKQRDGWVVWRWREAHRMPAYCLLLTIGKYDVRRSTGPHGLPIIDAVDPRVGKLGFHALAKEPEILRVLEHAFGRYPYESAGGVVDTAGVGYSLETVTRPFYPADELDGSKWDSALVAHELAHQWFGDSVSLRRWHDIWLNEGFATYAEWLWGEHEGFDSPHEELVTLAAKPADDPFWKLNISRPSGAHLFDDPVYLRGAMTLQVLREQVGDRPFFRILRTWTRDHRDGHGTTAQFVALAEGISGQQLDELFDAWLFSTGKPAAA